MEYQPSYPRALAEIAGGAAIWALAPTSDGFLTLFSIVAIGTTLAGFGIREFARRMDYSGPKYRL